MREIIILASGKKPDDEIDIVRSIGGEISMSCLPYDGHIDPLAPLLLQLLNPCPVGFCRDHCQMVFQARICGSSIRVEWIRVAPVQIGVDCIFIVK